MWPPGPSHLPGSESAFSSKALDRPQFGPQRDSPINSVRRPRNGAPGLRGWGELVLAPFSTSQPAFARASPRQSAASIPGLHSCWNRCSCSGPSSAPRQSTVPTDLDLGVLTAPPGCEGSSALCSRVALACGLPALSRTAAWEMGRRAAALRPVTLRARGHAAVRSVVIVISDSLPETCRVTHPSAPFSKANISVPSAGSERRCWGPCPMNSEAQRTTG